MRSFKLYPRRFLIYKVSFKVRLESFLICLSSIARFEENSQYYPTIRVWQYATTLNKIILMLCHICREKRNIYLLSPLIRCRLISVCTTVHQTPCLYVCICDTRSTARWKTTAALAAKRVCASHKSVRLCVRVCVR